MKVVVFEWDENNLRKIRAHRIKAAEIEQALASAPILMYEQDAGGESRYVYYAETNRGRLLAIVLTERQEKIRVITAYDLDADRSMIISAAAREESEVWENRSKLQENPSSKTRMKKRSGGQAPMAERFSNNNQLRRRQRSEQVRR